MFIIIKKIKKLSVPKFYRQETGTSMLEFAIILPLFMLLIFGTIQLGLIMVIMNALDAAAREAARYGITGTTATGLTRDASIEQVIQTTLTNYTGGIINTAKVRIDVDAFPDLSSLGNVPLGTLNSFGTGGQVVRYRLEYDWDIVFPIFGSKTNKTLIAETAVVNEQF